MNVHITYHAVERYRERIADALPDDLRTRLAPAAAVGAKRYSLDGVTYCLRYQDGGCIVTTVYDGKPSRIGIVSRAPRNDLSRKESRRRARRNRKH